VAARAPAEAVVVALVQDLAEVLVQESVVVVDDAMEEEERGEQEEEVQEEKKRKKKKNKAVVVEDEEEEEEEEEAEEEESEEEESEEEEEGEGDEKWEVEKLLNHKNNKRGKLEYRVKWKEFSAKFNSWEPASVIETYAREAVAAYKKTKSGKKIALNKKRKRVVSTTAVAKLFFVTIFVIAASAKHYFNAMRKTVIKVARGVYL
jgi:cobalamin biosynthesis protein CobT